MWRMMRADGQSSHALIDPLRRKRTIWFVNGRPLGFREFDDLDSASAGDQFGPELGGRLACRVRPHPSRAISLLRRGHSWAVSDARPGAELLFVAPDFERKRTRWRVQHADDDPGPIPSALFIKTRGVIVADRAGEPGGVNTVGDARAWRRPSTRRLPRSACRRRHEQLRQLVAHEIQNPTGRGLGRRPGCRQSRLQAAEESPTSDGA